MQLLPDPLGPPVLDPLTKLVTSVLRSCLACRQAWLLRLLQEALQPPQSIAGENVSILSSTEHAQSADVTCRPCLRC